MAMGIIRITWIMHAILVCLHTPFFKGARFAHNIKKSNNLPSVLTFQRAIETSFLIKALNGTGAMGLVEIMS